MWGNTCVLYPLKIIFYCNIDKKKVVSFLILKRGTYEQLIKCVVKNDLVFRFEYQT